MFSTKTYEICRETKSYGPYSGKENQSLEIIPEEAHMWDLLGKGFKFSVSKMFKELKKTMFKDLKESMRRMSYQISRNYFLKEPVLAGVAQLVEHGPMHQKVVDSIPG